MTILTSIRASVLHKLGTSIPYYIYKFQGFSLIRNKRIDK